jgi:hypothetical protein
MQRSSLRAIMAASAILLLVAPAAADFSIQPVSEPADYKAVSPESMTAQFVRLEDAEGDPVNRSRLESRDNLIFRYDFNGTPYRMDYVTEGYYYAKFMTNSSGREVAYRIVDTSPTTGGEVNFTEDLEAGKLDVDIVTGFSGSEKAGDTITVTAGVNNLMQYYAVDVDDSGGITEEDEFVIDRGGSGTYSDGADILLAGTAPENGENLQSSNPWSSAMHPVRVNDSASGDGWDDSNDIILVDRFGGGTVSTEPDSVINSGNNNDLEAEPGTELSGFNSLSTPMHFVSSDQQLNPGEEIIYDNDSDGMFTRSPDQVIAGNIPNEGTPITYIDSISSSLEVSSYDANNGDSWDGSVDALARDFDDDGMYSTRSEGDVVLNGTTPDEGTELETSGVNAWEDQGTDTATEGEVEVYDANSGDSWDPANDAIWRESGSTAGYQSAEDKVLAGSPQEGRHGSDNSNRFEQWESISAYVGDDDCCYNSSEDAIIRDWHGGGTFSTRDDRVIAGSVTGAIEAGTQYSQENGFVDAWELDVIDASQGGAWSSNQDTILKDRNEGGTFSVAQDTVVNSGGEVSSEGGTDIYRLDTFVSDSKMYADVDSSGDYSPGDEIFMDQDHDGHYTSRSDDQLAGISLRTAGSGTGLEEGNPWSGDSKPVMFYDAESGDEWNISEDAVIQDIDGDGTYTAYGDTVVSDEEGEIQAEAGDDLLSTDRTNFSTPEVTIRFSNGSYTSDPVELGKKPDGNFTNTVELPDQPGSTFLVQVRAETPISNLEGTESAVMSTRKRGIGFSSNSSISLSPGRAGTHSKNVTLENFLDEENRIEVNVSESLENITGYPETSFIGPSVTEEVRFDFNLTPIEEHTGHIIFMENETGMTDRTEVDINTPSCAVRTEKICVDQGSIYVSSEERQNITRTLDIESIWKEDENVNVDARVDGTISDYIELNTTSMNFEDSGTVELTFRPTERGNYSGALNLEADGETAEIDLELEANVMELDRGLSVKPGEVDLGAVPSGSDQTFTVEIENTGSLEITELNVTSDQLSLSSDISDSLEAGETLNFSITAESMESEKGTVNINGQTSEGSVTGSTDISSSFIKPVSDMKQEINSKISDLRSQATSSEIQTQLTNLGSKTSSIDTQWQKGNYEQAESIYDSTMTSLNSVETQISSNSGTGTDTGETGGTDNQNQQQQPEQNSGGGGGAIIIVAVLLLLILGAGFVLYTSYYPEEGDPLYDVLGDRE